MGGTQHFWSRVASLDRTGTLDRSELEVNDDGALQKGTEDRRHDPLMGGMDPDLAWESLRLVEERVLPALRS